MTNTHPAPPAPPPPEALAHREVQLRIVLDHAGIDVTDLVSAAALMSIAIDAFHDHPPAAVHLLVSEMHKAVQQRALMGDEAFTAAIDDAWQGAPPITPRRGQNVCCEHVARGAADVHSEAELGFITADGLPVRVLARLCEACSKLELPTAVYPEGMRPPA